MCKMPASVRDNVINAARKSGFIVNLKPDGFDVYDKVISFSMPGCQWPVYVDKVTGISKSGQVRCFKVAVHPEFYGENLESKDVGVTAWINQKTKKNLHSHSGYHKFPIFEGNTEPCGMAYKANDLNALDHLFRCFVDKAVASQRSLDGALRNPG
jgi:hypothetical protein